MFSPVYITPKSVLAGLQTERGVWPKGLQIYLTLTYRKWTSPGNNDNKIRELFVLVGLYNLQSKASVLAPLFYPQSEAERGQTGEN